MPRLSAVESFLNSLSIGDHEECRNKILAARTSKEAHEELKKIGYAGSYDAVVNWRNANFARLPNDTLQERANRIVQVCTSENFRDDPVRRATDLAAELEALCYRFSGLLHNHKWVNDDGILSNKDAFKLLSILPALSKVCVSTTLELYRIKVQMNEKAIALGLIAELADDWQKTFSSENPELLGLFESVVAITRSRLQLDGKTLLDQAMEAPEN